MLTVSWKNCCWQFQEVGHWLAAAPRKVKMGIPFLIPNITLGSFGAITQVFWLLKKKLFTEGTTYCLEICQ